MKLTLEILELIKKGSTIEQIQQTLSLSHKKIYYYIDLLEKNGLLINRKYYYNGDLKYQLAHDFQEDRASLITRHSDTDLKFLLLSDLHLASSEENLSLLNEVYNFCIKEDIHVILNAGDFIDGFVGTIPKLFDNGYEQIEYAIKKHPYDSSIINFLVLGNHDYSTIKIDGVALDKMLKRKRHDIKVVGYGEGKLLIKNDFLVIKHPLKNGKTNDCNYNNALILKGHSHRMKMIMDDNNCILYVPTISNILSENTFPGIIVMNLKTLNGYFQEGIFECFNYINNQFYRTSEIKVHLGNGKDFSKDNINYEENYKVLKKER